MVFVVKLGKGEGRSPGLLNLDAGLDLVHGLEVFFESVDLRLKKELLCLGCQQLCFCL